jgi:anthranilate/para-aminobenzoate synthase component II
MGLQCIGEAFGGWTYLNGPKVFHNLCSCLADLSFVYDYTGKIIRVPSGVMHGKSSPVYYDEVVGKDLFEGLAKYDFSTI